MWNGVPDLRQIVCVPDFLIFSWIGKVSLPQSTFPGAHIRLDRKFEMRRSEEETMGHRIEVYLIPCYIIHPDRQAPGFTNMGQSFLFQWNHLRDVVL